MLRIRKNGEKLLEITDSGQINLLKEGLEIEDVLGKKEDEKEKEETKDDETDEQK